MAMNNRLEAVGRRQEGSGVRDQGSGNSRTWRQSTDHWPLTTDHSLFGPTAYRLPPTVSRSAFTLAEMLVVIAIIAVLAGITGVAVMRAMDTAKQARIKIEVDGLATALEQYKLKYGAYPPTDLRSSNQVAVKQHVYRAFPRYYNISRALIDIANVVDPNHTDPNGCDTLRPDKALVFWLNGFNPDPTQPFSNLAIPYGSKSQRTTPFFDFDPSRLKPLATPGSRTDQFPSYVPPGIKNNAPYVYFDSASYGDLGAASPAQPPNITTWNAAIAYDQGRSSDLASAGFAAPYVNDTNANGTYDPPTGTPPTPVDNFVNPDSYQLIAAGLDGKYGSTYADNSQIALSSMQNETISRLIRFYPMGTPTNPPPAQTYFGYDARGADDDNVTNFCNKARLGDAKP